MSLEQKTSEATELLQEMVRNRCVNDGTIESGQEVRTSDLLESYLENSPVEIQTYEPAPGRKSLVARLEGKRKDAPSLLLMGHTDVVPALPDGWDQDPFGGDLIDGFVWGRGTTDMLCLTASMAVAMKHLASSGYRPDGTLIFAGVADEEATAAYGAGHIVEHEYESVAANYVISEAGGFPIETPGGLRIPIIVGEKGVYWCRMRIKGTPGHGSQPYKTDNALVTAAEIVQRLHKYRPETNIHEIWRAFIENLGYPAEITEPLLNPDGLLDFLDIFPVGMARQLHACTHTTIAPTVAHGGLKVNSIPDLVELEIDIRTLPGQKLEDVHAILQDALGELYASVEIEMFDERESTSSPIETPLWDSLANVSQKFYPGSTVVPYLTVGSTDNRFFRKKGVTSYGFGMFSQKLSFEEYGQMFHGDNERVDVESLGLATDMWEIVSKDLLTVRE